MHGNHCQKVPWPTIPPWRIRAQNRGCPGGAEMAVLSPGLLALAEKGGQFRIDPGMVVAQLRQLGRSTTS